MVQVMEDKFLTQRVNLGFKTNFLNVPLIAINLFVNSKLEVIVEGGEREKKKKEEEEEEQEKEDKEEEEEEEERRGIISKA
jgi:hypothetical protein